MPMFKLSLTTHEISAVGFTSVSIPFDATCCVSVLLSAVDVPVGIQQVLGSTPTAVAMPLHCLYLSLSFQSAHKVLFCNSISTAKTDSFSSPPLYP